MQCVPERGLCEIVTLVLMRTPKDDSLSSSFAKVSLSSCTSCRNWVGG